MKKCTLLAIIFLACMHTNAQYKKASFLRKKGRTYDLGFTTRLLGGGNSVATGFSFGYGKERSDKRLFHWWDLDLILGNKFKYNTTANIFNGSTQVVKPVSVSGKTPTSVAWRYNLAFYILDNGNEDNKILPFVDLSIGILIPLYGKTTFETSPVGTSQLEQSVQTQPLGYSAGIGVGAIYKVNSGFGVKFNAAYYGLLTSEDTKGSSNINYFKTLPNHVSVSVGAHWLLDRDND
jgi:hypothetical protein